MFSYYQQNKLLGKHTTKTIKTPIDVRSYWPFCRVLFLHRAQIFNYIWHEPSNIQTMLNQFLRILHSSFTWTFVRERKQIFRPKKTSTIEKPNEIKFPNPISWVYFILEHCYICKRNCTNDTGWNNVKVNEKNCKISNSKLFEKTILVILETFSKTVTELMSGSHSA